MDDVDSLARWALRFARLLDTVLQACRRRLLPAELVLFEDSTGPWLASGLGAVCQLDLAERVPKVGSLSLAELALELRCPESALLRLLRLVAAHGYFALSSDGTKVRHTRLSKALSSQRAGNFCQLQASSWYRDCFACDRVVEAMKADLAPYDYYAGENFFSNLSKNEPKARLFQQAMADITRFCTPYLLSEWQFQPGERVLDVGGGNGELAQALALGFPQATFSVLDIEPAPRHSDVEILQGNFLDSVPPGFDHFVLKNILHDWNDEICEKILRHCRQSGGPGSRISVIEILLPADFGSGFTSARDFSVDWNLYCTLGGQERTLAQYSGLLQRSGWELREHWVTGTPLWVLTGRAI